MLLFNNLYPEPIDTTNETTTKGLQKALGVKQDGKFGPKTMEAYEKRFGPRQTIRKRWFFHQFPMPQDGVNLWGYAHMEGWPLIDPAFEAFTEPLTFENGLARLVAGYRGEGKFSRSPKSYVSLDGGSIGLAHWWSKRVPRVVPQLIDLGLRSHDEAFEYKVAKAIEFGLDVTSFEVLASMFPAKRGRINMFNPVQYRFMAWWNQACETRGMMQAQVEFINNSLKPLAKPLLKRYKIKPFDLRSIAGIMRMCNSSPARAKRCLKAAYRRGRGDLVRRAMETPKKQGGYSHPERWQAIVNEPRFD